MLLPSRLGSPSCPTSDISLLKPNTASSVLAGYSLYFNPVQQYLHSPSWPQEMLTHSRWIESVYNCTKRELYCECRMTSSPWKLGVIISSAQFIFHSGFIFALFTLIIEEAEKLVVLFCIWHTSPDICHILLQNHFHLFNIRSSRKRGTKILMQEWTTIMVTIHNVILCIVQITYKFTVQALFSKGIWKYWPSVARKLTWSQVFFNMNDWWKKLCCCFKLTIYPAFAKCNVWLAWLSWQEVTQ